MVVLKQTLAIAAVLQSALVAGKGFPIGGLVKAGASGAAKSGSKSSGRVSGSGSSGGSTGPVYYPGGVYVETGNDDDDDNGPPYAETIGELRLLDKNEPDCPQVKNHGCYYRHARSPLVEDIEVFLNATDAIMPLCGPNYGTKGYFSGYKASELWHGSAAVAIWQEPYAVWPMCVPDEQSHCVRRVIREVVDLCKGPGLWMNGTDPQKMYADGFMTIEDGENWMSFGVGPPGVNADEDGEYPYVSEEEE